MQDQIDYEDETIPLIFRRAHYYWQWLFDNSQEDPDHTRWRLFVGKASTPFYDPEITYLSPGNYSGVKHLLEAQDSIRMLRRGGGRSPSVISVKDPPSLQTYLDGDDKPYDKKPPMRYMSKGDMTLQVQIKELQARMQDLEDTMKELLRQNGYRI